MHQQIDTARGPGSLAATSCEPPTWATYSELKRELLRLNLSPAEYEIQIRELCRALEL